MKTLKFLTGILTPPLFVLLTAGCQSKSSDLVDPPESYQAVEASGTGISVEFNPKVDILFLIDDSYSMRPHQARLVRNIDRFVEAFAQFDVIDFHIGAVTVWDSRRYRSALNPEGVVPEVSSDGFRNFYPMGQLQPLRAPETHQELLQNLQGQNFVSRTEGFTEILRSTLLGIEPKCHESYRDCSPPMGEGRGPEFEEHFSPVAAALADPELLNGANRGFRRPDAHLVVIFITDADDGSTNISASQMAAFLRDLTDSRREQNFSIYGVIHPTNRASTEACPKDPSGNADKLMEFFRLTEGETLDICSDDYGTLLSNIGNQIRRRAFAEVIPLQHLPEYQIRQEEITEEGEDGTEVTRTREVIEWIEVLYGDQVIPNDPETGWTYDVERNSIIIHEGLEIEAQEGARLTIRYTPVNTRNGRGGRAQRL